MKEQAPIEALAIFKAMNKRVIAFNPAFVDLTGSITAALLMSQLLFWAEKMDYKEFYKTDKQIREETKLGKYELIQAKKIVSEFFDIQRKGSPARTYYKPKMEVILANLSSCLETRQQVVLKPDNQLSGNQITIIQENKQENTTKEPNTAAPTARGVEPKASTLNNDDLVALIDAFKPVNPTGYRNFFKNTSQRAALERLTAHMGVESLKAKIAFLDRHNKESGTWKIVSPTQLEERLSAMELFWQDKKNKLSGKSRLTIGVTAEGKTVARGTDGWIYRETGEPYDGEVYAKEDYDKKITQLKSERIAACGKCRDGWVSTGTGERLCSCIDGLCSIA